MIQTINSTQSRYFVVLVLMTVLFILKGPICHYLFDYKIGSFVLPPDGDYHKARMLERRVNNAVFVYELICFSLCVVLINSLQQAKGLVPNLVKVIVYLIVTVYVLGIVFYFFSSFLPHYILG